MIKVALAELRTVEELEGMWLSVDLMFAERIAAAWARETDWSEAA